MPKRIQRSRSKGWKMPEGVVYVGRPGKWGNPYKVGAEPYNGDNGQTLEEALWAYEHIFLMGKDLSELRGKDLACWCPLDQPCHADILLRLSNTASTRQGVGVAKSDNEGDTPCG